MELILNWLHSGLSAIGPFLILLGLLIFVHELGHFLVAKWCGVRVEVFSLGFGKKILKYTHGETTYCISIIPLGGYVKMYGDDPTAEVPESEKNRAFLHKPVGQRIAIVLAGPLMNFLFAIPLFMAVGLNGEQVPGTVLGDIHPQTPAFQAGFRSGDKIISVNENPVEYWSQVNESIEKAVNQEILFSVLRASSEKAEVKATPVFVANDNILSLDSQVGRVPGLEITSRASMIGIVSPESLAARAGLKNFDIIASINGKKITSYWELEPSLQALRDQDKIQLIAQAYNSSGKTESRSITIAGFRELTSSLKNGDAILPLLGLESAELYLLKVKEKSPAAVAGLQDGDRILALNQTPVQSWDQVLQTVKSFNPGNKVIHFSVRREDKILELDITPEMTEVMNRHQKEESRFTVGIIPALVEVNGEPVLFRVKSPWESFTYGFDKTLNWTKAISVSFLRILTAQVSHKNIGGVITIGRVASQSFEIGLSAFLKMMAIISINLFLINLLPVPILDGGHLVFFTIEALRGAPLSMRKMEIAQQVGLILLISLMVLSLFNDITNFVHSP